MKTCICLVLLLLSACGGDPFVPGRPDMPNPDGGTETQEKGTQDGGDSGTDVNAAIDASSTNPATN